MSQYLLDTDICIFFLKDKFQITEKILDVGSENCFLSEITILELTYGAYNSQQVEKHLREVTKLELLFGIIPIYDSSLIFGKEKARLRREGNLIPDFDLLIGAAAIENDLILVTNNEAHFKRLDGVEIDNWAKK